MEMISERAHAVGKTRSAIPSQHFLSAVRKKYESQHDASDSHNLISVSPCKTLDHQSFSSTANFLPSTAPIILVIAMYVSCSRLAPSTVRPSERPNGLLDVDGFGDDNGANAGPSTMEAGPSPSGCTKSCRW